MPSHRGRWIGLPRERVPKSAMTSMPRRNGALRITRREREIVEFICRGLKNKEIAEALSITPGTVKVHLMHIFEKTGVKDRFQLALQGRQFLSAAEAEGRLVKRRRTDGILRSAHRRWLRPLSRPRSIHGWGSCSFPRCQTCSLSRLMVWLFGVGEGWRGLVLDGDTGWHIRTGEYILQHASAPQSDIFSYSKAGAPWFAWEWLTDVQYALLHASLGPWRCGGRLGLLICASAYTLLRTMLWTGANVFVSLVLTLLYVGALLTPPPRASACLDVVAIR